MSVFVGLQSYFGDADWIKIGIPLSNVTNPGGVACVPQNGILDTSIGQLEGWSSFWMTKEFLNGNNCEDPCGEAVGIDTLFRSVDEMFVFTQAAVDRWYESGQHLSHKDLLHLKLVYLYFRFMLFFLPFILVQGVMQVMFFWRTSPQRARWRIYTILSGGSTDQPDSIPKRKTARSRFAWTMALLFYIFALIVLVGAPIALFVTVLATEYTVQFIRQSETNVHVDQWGALAITGFVVIAAIICRLDPGRRVIWHEAKFGAKLERKKQQIAQYKAALQGKPYSVSPLITKGQSKNFGQQLWNLVIHISRACREAPLDVKNSAVYHAKNAGKALAYEWFLFVQFCKHPQMKPRRREKAGDEWQVTCPESRHSQRRRDQEDATLSLRKQYEDAKKDWRKLLAENGTTAGIADEESLTEKRPVTVTTQRMNHTTSNNSGDLQSDRSSHGHAVELPSQNPAVTQSISPEQRHEQTRPLRKPLPHSKQTTW